MALPIPLIAAGMSLLGQGANMAFTGSQNRKTRKWNEKMYAMQRTDALADWNMQNEYNSPAQQMERLKAAGINPRLAYTGGGGADNQGSVVRSTNVDAWNPKAPEFDAGAVTGAYFNTKMQQAQIDNLEAQNKVIQQEAMLKLAQTWETTRRVEKSDIDLGELQEGGTMYQKLRETQLAVAQSMLEKTKAETSVLLQRNEREALTNVQSLKEGVERILTLRQGRQLSSAQIKSINQDTELKQLDIQLRKQYNLSPSDPVYIRLLTYFIEKFGLNK